MYFFTFILLFISSFFYTDGRLNKLCRDPECKERLCRGQTASLYFAPEEGFLSFKQGEPVNIYGISSGSRNDLYLSEIGGKRGFAPKDLITLHVKCDETKLSVTVDENNDVAEDVSLTGKSSNSENPAKKDGATENEKPFDEESNKALEESTLNAEIKDDKKNYNDTEEQLEADESPSRVIHESTTLEPNPRESFTSTFLQHFLESQPEITETDVSSESISSVISTDNIHIAITPTSDSPIEETELKDLQITESHANMVQNSISNSPTVTVFDGTTITDGEDFVEVASTTEKSDNAFLSAKQMNHGERYMYPPLILSTKLSDTNIKVSEKNVIASESSVANTVEGTVSTYTKDIFLKEDSHSSHSTAQQISSGGTEVQFSSEIIDVSRDKVNDFSTMEKENEVKNGENRNKENDDSSIFSQSSVNSFKDSEIIKPEPTSAIFEESLKESSYSENVSSESSDETQKEVTNKNEETLGTNIEHSESNLINDETEIEMKKDLPSAEHQRDNPHNMHSDDMKLQKENELNNRGSKENYNGKQSNDAEQISENQNELTSNLMTASVNGLEVNTFSSIDASSDATFENPSLSSSLLLHSSINDQSIFTSDASEETKNIFPSASEKHTHNSYTKLLNYEISTTHTNSYSQVYEKYEVIHDSVGFLNDNESEKEKYLVQSEDNKQDKVISFPENTWEQEQEVNENKLEQEHKQEIIENKLEQEHEQEVNEKKSEQVHKQEITENKLEQEHEQEINENKAEQEHEQEIIENDLEQTHSLIHSENSIQNELNDYRSLDDSFQDAQRNSGSTLGMVDDYIDSLKLYLQILIDILPEPLHSSVLDLESQGVSPRVTVFTSIAALSSVFLIAFIFLIKTYCKEKELLGYLCALEQKYFNVDTERNITKDNLEVINNQKSALENKLKEEQAKGELLEQELDEIKAQNSTLMSSLEKYQSQVDSYKYSKCELQDLEKKLIEENSNLNQNLMDSQEKITSLESHITHVESELQSALSQKEEFENQVSVLNDRVIQLEESCSQLLEEARLWDCRVKELTIQTEGDKLRCDELQESITSKDKEIEGLQIMLKEFEVIQKLTENEEDSEVEKKIHQLISANVDLQTANNENKQLKEMLTSEKAKVMDFEVKMAEASSTIEKLKLNYNHALQDKTEAQTKLDVLSNYFKEKEMQLQKELGVQEAMRQMKEEDASSASRRVTLIEQENSSYKHQVASLKQEIEETERNFKNQLVSQEKKAHDNWVAARAAERKMEEAKQEAAQLRQRLTLLEREQESWSKKSFDGIVRPVPKRYPGPNGEPQSPGLPLDTSIDSSDRLNPPFTHQMIGDPDSSSALPPDRPLPPPAHHPLDHIPPPPMLGHPFFPLDPWRFPPPGPIPPFHPLESRMTPPDYEQTTPPRGNRSSPSFDRESDRLSNSPRDHSRDSRSASPPYSLPRFHNIPPPRPYGYPFHPPPSGSRLPFPPPPLVHRREPLPPGHPDYRSDSRNTDPIITSSPRGIGQNSPQRDKSSTAV